MKAEKYTLENMMQKIKHGTIQLPDFQRKWVWNDDKIKSLLESVIRGFPINSILLLECDASGLKFARHPIFGAEAIDTLPQHLILDGQQRLTSLFGALYCDKAVKIKSGKEYFYYVDMAKAIKAVKDSSDEEDMIISVPPSKKLKAKGINWDLSSPEKEYAAGMFPLNKIFDSRKWVRAYDKFHNDNVASDFVDEFEEAVIKKVCSYEIVSIELEKNTPTAAVCKIFDKVNSDVEKLGVFDLLTAIFAAHTDKQGKSIELRKDWEKIQEDFAEQGLEVLAEVDCSDFITALTLLVSYENFRADKTKLVSCKGADILKLDCEAYLKYKNDIVDGFNEAGKFLAEEGITTKKYIPYQSQLIPMAAIFAELKLSGKDNAASRKKIRRWYWCAVFSESYKDGQGARYAKDIVQVMKWLDKREEPEIIRKAQIGAKRLMTVKSGSSAAYKGMISLILKNGATDFLAGKNIGSGVNHAESVEVHHIFPKRYCADRGLSKDKYDSIANKTLILKGTNRIIGSNPPSIYLEKIQSKTGLSRAEVDGILELHFADAALCRADDFENFIVDRADKIFSAIEELTGLKVVGAPLK